MSEVRLSAAAQSDLLDIVVFIARDNPRAAEDWLAAIEEMGVLKALGEPEAAQKLQRHFELHGVRNPAGPWPP